MILLGLERDTALRKLDEFQILTIYKPQTYQFLCCPMDTDKTNDVFHDIDVLGLSRNAIIPRADQPIFNELIGRSLTCTNTH